MDIGSEFRSCCFRAWCDGKGIRLDFIEPGTLIQHSFIEGLNGRFRDECSMRTGFTTCVTPDSSPRPGAADTIISGPAAPLPTGRLRSLPTEIFQLCLVEKSGHVTPNFHRTCATGC